MTSVGMSPDLATFEARSSDALFTAGSTGQFKAEIGGQLWRKIHVWPRRPEDVVCVLSLLSKMADIS